MPDQLFSWLPAKPTGDVVTLLVLGLLLAAGVLGASLCRRLLRVPFITGCLISGLVIGPSGLNLLTQSALSEFRFIIDIALGLVLFELGRRIDVRWLLRERWLLVTGLSVSALTFTALFLGLTGFGMATLPAGMAASIGITSSPAVALLLVRELKSEGQLTERMLHLTVLGNVLAILLFAVCLSAHYIQHQPVWYTAMLNSSYRILGGCLLGGLAARLLTLPAVLKIESSMQQSTLIIAAIALVVGLGSTLGLSSLMALLVMGASTRSTLAIWAIREDELAPINAMLCTILFVYTGAQISLRYLPDFASGALGFIALRTLAMTSTTGLLAWFNGISWKKGMWLGVSLFPMSGVATLLALHVSVPYPDLGAALSALMITVLALLELTGPLVLRLVLKASGEAKS
ncbi:Kef-type K+ transport system membrane component KefB [Chitinivorax tropicus]|uniref:Kef-type K+ transport system membrane component KefB n=1 Tax=Chitinivorax tropicus TaxID=714531 RepID=A0A840MTM0_9PROT|nr:cation:proton antiporter [Chitinivorax tropicus]MBB5019716.1 Kef-type K+ transport system membrane component KefB [Chitinivorax tropicus]